MDALKWIGKKLLSRKLWVALAGILVPVINRKTGLGLDPLEVAGIATAASAYVLGEAHVDAKRAEKGS